MLCPCQSKQPFSTCCSPFIKGDRNPQTPEQLMRSRYSAYATNNINYILNTYSSVSKAQQSLTDIQSWSERCQWVNLVIHQAPVTTSHEGMVEFSAYFIEDNQLCEMRERSNFIQEDTLWKYHDGDMLESTVFNKTQRNALCPCQQGKKFKQCCGKYLR